MITDFDRFSIVQFIDAENFRTSKRSRLKQISQVHMKLQYTNLNGAKVTTFTLSITL